MRDPIDYLDLTPEENPIREIYVWIGVHTDGREAMLSADLPFAFGKRHAPLMSSRRETAEMMGRIARQIQRAAMHRAARFVKIELRTFKAAPDG